MIKILLGHLASNGDCLYATTLARQIKHDMPDCHLTWAISSMCAPVLRNNPDVDEVMVVPVADRNQQEQAWYTVEGEVARRQSAGAAPFDRTIMSQIWPNNFARYDGTIRPSILRAYGQDITVPVKTVVNLDAEEMENVARFVADKRLKESARLVVFECTSKSGQSYVTPEFAVEVAKKVKSRTANTAFVMATHQRTHEDDKIVNGSSLSMRETGGLIRHADLFIGCGSGVTVISTSTVAPEIPNIQILSGATSVYASFAHDLDYYGVDTSRFVEMHDVPAESVADAACLVLEKGVTEARRAYHRDPSNVSFKFYRELIEKWLLDRLKFADAARSTLVTAERYGWQPELLSFARDRVAPLVMNDPSCRLTDVREEMRNYLDLVWGSH